MCMARKLWKTGTAVGASIAALGLLAVGITTHASTPKATVAGNADAVSSGKPTPGGSITLDTDGDFKDLDPALAYDTISGEIVDQMYNPLVTYKGTTSQLTGDLASSWKVSKDGKTYTFQIRPGVKFWNGDPVTAQSFVDEFQRVLSPSVGSPGEGFLDPIVVGSTAYNKGKAKTVSGIKAIGKYTLQIKLTKPEPFFLQVLAMPFFSAVDQAFIDKVGNKAFDSQTAMGTGPFELSKYTGTQVVLKKNPDYFMKDKYGNRLPYLDQITINVNKNDQVDALHFEDGQTALIADLFAGIPSSVYPTFLNSPTLKKDIIKAPSNATYYLGLNNKLAPFNNVKVRQAVEYAINKQRIVQLLNNRFMVADQPLPPGIDGYMKNLPASVDYKYNPAKAKALLKQSGVKDLNVTLYSENTADAEKIDDQIQSDMNAVGFHVKIDSMDWNSFLTLTEKGKAQAFQLAWIQDFPDASDFLNTLFNSNEIASGNNASMYDNKQVDSWLNEAETDTNQAQRIQLYDKATVQIMKDAPWVPLYYGEFVYAVQPWVHGFYINPTLMDPLQAIWIDKSHQ